MWAICQQLAAVCAQVFPATGPGVHTSAPQTHQHAKQPPWQPHQQLLHQLSQQQHASQPWPRHAPATPAAAAASKSFVRGSLLPGPSPGVDQVLPGLRPCESATIAPSRLPVHPAQRSAQHARGLAGAACWDANDDDDHRSMLGGIASSAQGPGRQGPATQQRSTEQPAANRQHARQGAVMGFPANIATDCGSGASMTAAAGSGTKSMPTPVPHRTVSCNTQSRASQSSALHSQLQQQRSRSLAHYSPVTALGSDPQQPAQQTYNLHQAHATSNAGVAGVAANHETRTAQAEADVCVHKSPKAAGLQQVQALEDKVAEAPAMLDEDSHCLDGDVNDNVISAIFGSQLPLYSATSGPLSSMAAKPARGTAEGNPEQTAGIRAEKQTRATSTQSAVQYKRTANSTSLPCQLPASKRHQSLPTATTSAETAAAAMKGGQPVHAASDVAEVCVGADSLFADIMPTTSRLLTSVSGTAGQPLNKPAVMLPPPARPVPRSEPQRRLQGHSIGTLMQQHSASAAGAQLYASYGSTSKQTDTAATRQGVEQQPGLATGLLLKPHDMPAAVSGGRPVTASQYGVERPRGLPLQPPAGSLRKSNILQDMLHADMVSLDDL